MALCRRGNRWLARLLPGRYGETLSPTSYVIIASLQLLAPRLKEQRYLQRYGDDFRDYRRRVPYLLPAPGRRSDSVPLD